MLDKKIPNSGGMMKRVYIILLVTFVVALLPALSFGQNLTFMQYLQISDFPQYLDIAGTGGGARAAGMGNAYLGISDDEMAFSWNPASMIFVGKSKLGVQFESKADKFTMPWRATSDTLGLVSVENAKAKKNHFNLNTAGFAVPFNFLQREWTVGGGYKNQYDMKFEFDSPGFNGATNSYSQSGGVDAISVALAGKIIEGFGIGITANDYIRHSEVNIYEPKSFPYLRGDSVFVTDFAENYRSHFSGFNMDIGMSGEFNMFRAGLVIRTPYNLKEKFLRTLTVIIPEGNAGFIDRITTTTKIPLSYALGISAKPIEKLVVALDYESRPMSKSDIVVNFENNGMVSPADTDQTYSPQWKDLNEIRLGAEYSLSAGFAEIPLRAGFRILPSVGSGYTQDANGRITPGKQIKTNIISFGTGLHFQKAWIDLAYQFGSSTNTSTISFLEFTSTTFSQKQDYSRLFVSGGMNF